MDSKNLRMRMKCTRCLQQRPLEELHYAPDGKRMVCRACEQTPQQEEPPKKIPQGESKHYRCVRCEYTFTRKNIPPKDCPYCGRKTVVEYEKITGETLVDDS